MNIVEYEDIDLKKRLNENKDKGGFMSLINDEFWMSTNHKELEKIRFIFGKEIEWSDSTYKTISSEEYNKLYCGHWNDCDSSLGDVMMFYKSFTDENEEEQKKYDELRHEKDRHNRIERYKKWNIEINRCAYDTETFNIKLFDSKINLVNEEYLEDGLKKIHEYIDYLSQDGNDLIYIIANTPSLITLFSVKDNKYFGCIIKNNIGYFIHGYNLEQYFESMNNQLTIINN